MFQASVLYIIMFLKSRIYGLTLCDRGESGSLGVRLINLKSNLLTTISAAVETDPEAPAIDLTTITSLPSDLTTAVEAGRPRSDIIPLAQAFIKSSEFIGGLQSNNNALHKAALELGRILDKGTDKITDKITDKSTDKSTGKPKITAAGLRKAVKDTFGKAPEDALQDQQFQVLLRNLRDSVIAVKYVQVCH